MNVFDEFLSAPHALVAGATGSGKSVFLRGVIATALARPCYIAAVDLKRVELAYLRRLGRLIAYADEPEQVEPLLARILAIMEGRFSALLAAGRQMSNEPDIYVIIDELADLIATSPDALPSLIRLGRLGRAARVHLICATQAPARRNLPAALVQNIPVRLALRTTDAIESRQIIGVKGAEALPLVGSGLLRTPSAANPIRITGLPVMQTDQLIRLIAATNQIDGTRR